MKYLYLFSTSIQNALAYVGERIFRTILMCLILFIFFQLWKATFALDQSKVIAGFSIAQMLWYLVITEAIALSSNFRNNPIDTEIRSGMLAYTLIRPCHYLAFQYFQHMGDRLVNVAINLLVGSILALILVGTIEISSLNILALLISILFAVSLDYFFMMLIGLSAFWIENSEPIALLYSRLTMILGGLIFPIAIFPDWLAKICHFLPFASIYHAPAKIFVKYTNMEFMGLLAKQAFFLLLVGCIMQIVFSIAKRKVAVHGG